MVSPMVQWSRIPLQCKRHRSCGFDPWIGKTSWSMKWQPTPVFLWGKSHGQRSLENCSPQDHKESDMKLIENSRHMERLCQCSRILCPEKVLALLMHFDVFTSGLSWWELKCFSMYRAFIQHLYLKALYQQFVRKHCHCFYNKHVVCKC